MGKRSEELNLFLYELSPIDILDFYFLGVRWKQISSNFFITQLNWELPALINSTFQEKYGIETVGYVGPKTRAKLNEN